MTDTYPPPLADAAPATTWGAARSSLGRSALARLQAELMTAWSEPHRHYHDQRHLRECLALWTRWRDRRPRVGEVAIALLFHDAIYDPQASGNELNSAALAPRSLVRADADSVSDTAQRGSNTTVLEHVKRWKASNPRTVPVRSDDLPIDVMSSLQSMRDRAEATGEAKFAARLKEAEDERNDVAKENKQLLAQNEALQTEVSDLASERDKLKGQVQSHETELQTLREHLEREQESAQAARVELAKAQLKVEAADSRVAEAQQRESKALADMSRVSAALDAERIARAAADSRAAVAESQLASTVGALKEGQARVHELQTAVKEHDAVVARVAGAEAMAAELRSMVEMLRELLKAAEGRGGRGEVPLATDRQSGAGETPPKRKA